jgi:membrane-associated phospholipid phosphatase
MSLLHHSRSRVARVDEVVDAAFDRLRGHRAADRVFYAASELGDFSLIWAILGTVRGLRADRHLPAAVRLGVGRPAWAGERPHRLRQPRSSSFPSGHATAAFSAAVLLSEDDPYWPVYFLVASVVATSRIHVRIHHASDVVAGAGVGVALGLIGRKLYPLPKPIESQNRDDEPSVAESATEAAG